MITVEARGKPGTGLDRRPVNVGKCLVVLSTFLLWWLGIVALDSDWAFTVTNVLRTAGLVVLIAVGLIVLFIIVNSIRLAVVARAEEIEVMRLVGASDAFIRWPFVFEGAFIGLIGAIATLAVLAAAADPVGGLMVGFFEVLPVQLARRCVVDHSR